MASPFPGPAIAFPGHRVRRAWPGSSAAQGGRGPAYGAARLSRLDPRQSAMIAALVNTRGGRLIWRGGGLAHTLCSAKDRRLPPR